MKKVESLHTWQPPHPTIVCGRRYGVRQQRKSFPHLSMAANRDGIVDNRLPTGCFFSLLMPAGLLRRHEMIVHFDEDGLGDHVFLDAGYAETALLPAGAGRFVDALAEVVDRMLMVFPGELERRGEAVLREDPGTVEIIFALFGIVPSAHHIVVGAGVLDNGGDALLVEVVLGFLIGYRDTFCRLAQRIQAHGEALGVHLPHRPDYAGEFLVGEFLLRENRECGERRKAQKRKQTFHMHNS